MPDHAGVYLPPPVLYIGAARGLQRLVPIAPAPAALRVVAPVLAAGWAGLTLPIPAGFRRAGTSLVPIRPSTKLVMGGPYRVTRNPMYLGLLLRYLALGVWTRLTWALVLTPALVALVQALVIARAERYLALKFGADYAVYLRRVRRWM